MMSYFSLISFIYCLTIRDGETQSSPSPSRPTQWKSLISLWFFPKKNLHRLHFTTGLSLQAGRATVQLHQACQACRREERLRESAAVQDDRATVNLQDGRLVVFISHYLLMSTCKW